MPSQGMSIHVVDITRSRAAAGMKVDVLALDPGEAVLASGVVNARGLVDDARLLARLPAGRYEARFHVGDYFRVAGTPLPERPFLGVVRYPFGIADPDRHYHLPFKTSPWGFSCFLGA